MDVELARHQWADGRRALDRLGSDPAARDRLAARVAVLVDELTRRIGQTFTIAELASAYDGADRWALEALDDAFPDEVPSEVSTAAGAAFDLYARRASDYTP